MEGFLNIRMRPWLRRLITRSLAIVPSVLTILIWGEKGTTELLIFSQVILSMQLPFAIFPLVQFTSDRSKMKEFVNPRWVKWLAWGTGFLIAVLNLWLLADIFKQWWLN